ncbi:MAG TPA: VOC family protein [Acidobacteriaceae bacterium]|nr:VOC family protein [Acidobacteriaceae bacterium]
MNTNLHLGFQGDCDEAFSFYEKVFGTKRLMTMKYGDAPQGTPVPPDAKDLVMHTAMPVGNITLMGADAPPGKGTAMGGFQISIDDQDQAVVKRIFDALSEGGSVFMPLAPTFWSPLFGMCTDKFGVGWMLSVPGHQPS